jgi:hypothetical protein
MEELIKTGLDRWSDSGLAAWAKGQVGIGPVLAAGLAAHIDIGRAPTAGAVWRFAGVDPTQEWHGTKAAKELVKAAFDVEGTPQASVLWLARAAGRRPESLFGLFKGYVPLDRDRAWEVIGVADSDVKAAFDRNEIHVDNAILAACEAAGVDPGPVYADLFEEVDIDRTALEKNLAKIPYNKKLKQIVWKCGESFSRQRHRDGCWYGVKLKERRDYEDEKNARGEYESTALAVVARNGYKKGTDARKTCEEGKLPPNMVEARARRWTSKLFLAHLWEQGRHEAGLPVPAPYPIAYMGHVHMHERPEGR